MGNDVHIIIENLKTKCNTLIDENYALYKISRKIYLPTYNVVFKYLFSSVFSLFFIFNILRYLIKIITTTYITFSFTTILIITLHSLIFGVIIGGIIYVPCYFYIKYRREKIFLKSKAEIEDILKNIRILIQDITKHDIPHAYLNEYYLEEIRKVLTSEQQDLSLAISKFENQTIIDQSFEYKKEIANHRYLILSNLIELVNKPEITISLDKWKECYFDTILNIMTNTEVD